MRRVWIAGALALAAMGVEAADSYPNRPIRVVIPFAAGGNVDTFGRVLFRQVEREIGQSIVIDNRGGANSIVGSDIVAKANPDGYTYLATSFGFAVNPAITKKMPFDVVRDFLPVTNIALGAGYLMVVHNSVAAKSLKELVAVAKTKTLRYSTAGVGNGQHLAGALFASKIGADMIHVPYKGGGPAMIAVLGGETELHYPAPAVGVTHVKAGKVRALGFTGAERLAALPDVPTIGEVVPGYYSDAGWHAIFAPAKTPVALATRLQQAVNKALQVPQVRDHFVNNGYDPQGVPPAQWAKLFQEDLKRYAEICRIAGIQPQ